jgi:ABC-2 type transport system permease protein
LIRSTFVLMRKKWEDIKASLFSYHNLLAGMWPIFLFCAAFGIYEPLRIGHEWLQSPVMVFSLSMLIPFVVIGFISPYSFVGERERGTLEHLLATPVSDQALLFGKIGMPVLLGWGATLLTLLLGLGSINFLSTTGILVFYPLNTIILTALSSLLFSFLVATIGTSFSFYAKTFLDAQRNLVMTLFIPMLLPAFLVGNLMPLEWKGLIFQMIPQMVSTNLFLIIILLLLMADGIFILVALTRFDRKQMLYI